MPRRSCDEVLAVLERALRAKGLPQGIGSELGPLCLSHYAEARDGLAILLDLDRDDLLRALDDQPPRPRFSGCDVPERTWARASALAAKTYVPASAESRSGAGANINDNE